MDTKLNGEDWLAARQQALRIAKTTITPQGQTLDWIPLESQCNGAIATPPSVPASAMLATDGGKPVLPVSFNIGEQGPPGHVPILRPTLRTLLRSTNLAEALSKRGGLRVNLKRRNKQPADPNPAGYFHATSSQSLASLGCEARLNVWDPRVGIPSTAGDDHSISQTWLQNYAKPQVQSIEAGWTVDLTLNGDLEPHLFVYYTANGYGPSGDNLGGYNRMYAGWVQVHASLFPGFILADDSLTGGNQYELGIKFALVGGNWWFGINTRASEPWSWLGYYPGMLFNGGIANGAEWLAFGGEVYSGLANPCNTTDQMGSGIQADGGYRIAAYQRNLRSQTDANGTMVDFNGLPEVDAAASDCAVDNYTISCSMASGTGWGSYQYYGGPTPGIFLKIPTEGIWQWVDYGTMVDDGIHPWNPDFRYLLTGIVLADLAKYSSPSLTKVLLGVAAQQIEEAARGIVTEIKGYSGTLE